MSEEETMIEEPGGEAPAEAEAPDHAESDDHVIANWTVAVIPNENVSIHYLVTPRNESDAVTSVTTTFALKKDQMVVHTYAGATTQDLISPRAGQGVTGDCGVDASVFPAEVDGDLVAVLAGTVRTGETIANFYFEKPFDPRV